ncbi:MAG: DUF4153 domain-containing protein [bacterium]
MNQLLRKLIPLDDLKQTLLRFPLPALCCALFCCLIILSIHEFYEDLYPRLLALLCYGFFLFTLTQLLIESSGAAHKKILPLVGLLLFVGLIVSVYTGGEATLPWQIAYLVPALLLGIATVPFLRDNDDFSFWRFNQLLWPGIAVSILAGILWGAGLSAALAAIRYLFEVEIEGEIFGDIWCLAMLLFAPLYGLSWIPRDFRFREGDCTFHPNLGFIANWVFAPLTIVYLLILYAYFVRIALLQELPRGQLSYMVTAFAGIGVLTYLMSWPLRNEGRIQLRLIHRFFFAALIVPTAVQGIAIYQRIAQYGVTEQRYLVALSAVWFGCSALLFCLRKPPLKFLTGSLGVLLLLASFGPWSASQISLNSQFHRLESLLSANGLLVNGKVQPAETRPTFAERKSISSILDYLRRRERMDLLEPWRPEDKKKSDWLIPANLTDFMGFQFVHEYQRENSPDADVIRFSGSANRSPVVDVARFDYLIGQQHFGCWGKQESCHHKRELAGVNGDTTFILTYTDGELQVADQTGNSVNFNLNGLLKKEIETSLDTQPRAMWLEQSSEAFHARLDVFNLEGAREENSSEYRIRSVSLQLMIALTERP